jgi:phospholipid/cholesterol/gamma-HCH transport system substrate-binding protein
MTRERVGRAIGLGLFVCFSLGVAVYLLGRVGTTILPGASQYRFEADVQSSIALAPAADVREAGVEIGRVTAIKQAGTITALELSIDSKYGPVYHNATVLIRSKSVAGENYVSLDPGDPSSGALPSGGVLPVGQELAPTQDDDVFSILGRQQRQGLRTALAGLGGGLAGSGGNNLNKTLEALTALVDEGSNFSQVLADQRDQVASLVNSFGIVTAALGERAQDIQELTRAADVTAQAVSARDSELRATIAALPAFLRQGQETAQRLGSFSVNATPVMSNLRVAADALVPAVRDLRPAADEATRTLAALATFARVAQPTFNELRPFDTATNAFIPPYTDTLRQLNPFVAYLAPYWREVSNWFANDGAAVSYRDSIGNVARVLLPVSRSSLPALPAAVTSLLDQLAPSLDTRGINAYPQPGMAGTPGPLTSPPPRLTADPPYAKPKKH